MDRIIEFLEEGINRNQSYIDDRTEKINSHNRQNMEWNAEIKNFHEENKYFKKVLELVKTKTVDKQKNTKV